jgi:hypothetical protein
MSDGIVMSDGSVWPDGIVLSDSYVQSSCLMPSGAQMFAMETPVENAINIRAMTFYADGVVGATGDAYGRTVFLPQSMNLWGASLFDPTALAAGVGAEDANILANQDDTPITGVRLINGSSHYFPKQR